jgi:NADH-quinone oxidoreductase subunit H
MRPLNVAALVVTLTLAVLTVLGCSHDNRRLDLLTVLDVTPRSVDLGDRVEVIGIDFPEGRPATLEFNGALFRPGEKPQQNVSVKVDAVASSSSRIAFEFNEGLRDRFAGVGDRAAHTTFRGTLTVTFPGMPGSELKGAVTGVKDVVLDIQPPSTRRAVLEAKEKQGQEVLDFLGIQIADSSPSLGGLLVADVEPGKPAAAAGLAKGDVLQSFGGVQVASRADLIPSSSSQDVELGIRRGAGEVFPRPTVSMAGFHKSVTTDLLGAAILLLVALLIIGIFMAPTAGIITWVERRVSGRMQSRIGPNRTGPQGFLQWLADGIKSILKEDIIPTQADKPLFRLAPYLVFVGVSATFVVMPFGEYLIAADLDIGILYVVAVTSLVTIGLMTGGWASNNKWSLLGGIRSAAQIISYEIPGAVAIVCIVMMTGSLRMQEIVRAQGGAPWDWYMFRNPVTFALFFLYFTTALAEGNRAPFDLPEAESELVAGYSTEYSGMRYVFFFFAEWSNVFVMSGIVSALFLGGWQVPGIDPSQQAASFWLQALGAFVFLAKSWVLIFVVIWIRWTLPRIRIDQLMNLCWKWLVPMSFAAFVLTALWLLWDPQGVVRLAISGATFALFVVLMFHFARRVAFNMRSMQAQVHLNPFI